MIKVLFTLLLSALSIPALAGGGEDHTHGDEGAKSAVAPVQYFSAETVSDKYEALLKWGHFDAGEDVVLTLYLSNAATNLPVDSARIDATVVGGQKLEAKRTDKGVYTFTTRFPAGKPYAINFSLNSALGPDLLQVGGIRPGQELPEAAHEEAQAAGTTSPWLYVLGGLLGGALLCYVGMKIAGRKRAKPLAAGLVLLLLIPIGTRQATAHGDEPHGDEAGGGSGSGSNTFLVPKETQFLFKVETVPMQAGLFTESLSIPGTVQASSTGSATIQSPGTGRIVALNVRVGQTVSKGQVVAVIEQTVDAGTQISIAQQRSAADAELRAAKAQYDRLRAIQDIAAKRDVSEARARYETAQQNKRLLDANGGSAKQIQLVAPIGGVVGTFNYAIGAVVDAGETLFNITNLRTVYVEAQVYDRDAEALAKAGRFLVECTDDRGHKTAQVRLLAQPQEVAVSNQSQRVLFEMDNPGGDFKIGEYVNLRVFAGGPVRELSVPNSALTEVNGRPAVFIKDRAEQFSLSYVATGNNNGSYTIIGQGVESGEKVVTVGAYQLKMIFLNQ